MLRSVRVVAALALVLSACGGAAPAASTPPAAGAPAVTVQGAAFSPSRLEVAVGTAVTWTNKDGFGHTTTSGTPSAKDGKWDGQLSASGGTFSFTFAQAGTFAYFCQIHGGAMTAQVVVK